MWSQILPQQTGKQYTPTTLVLYTGGTRSGCGSAQAAMGPFYCPLDKKVYLDTGFFKEMASKFGVKGDFAYAYVIAHEVGHHVQDVLGILGKVQTRQQQASSKTEANALSVRIELMADCLAGVWAKNSNDKYAELDQGDIDEALNAAAQIGDDALQQRSQGYVVPDSFTHGSSAQRQRWFTAGYKSGQTKACDTFRTATTEAAGFGIVRGKTWHAPSAPRRGGRRTRRCARQTLRNESEDLWNTCVGHPRLNRRALAWTFRR